MSLPRRKDMTLNASLRRHDEARERASTTESRSLTFCHLIAADFPAPNCLFSLTPMGHGASTEIVTIPRAQTLCSVSMPRAQNWKLVAPPGIPFFCRSEQSRCTVVSEFVSSYPTCSPRQRLQDLSPSLPRFATTQSTSFQTLQDNSSG